MDTSIGVFGTNMYAYCINNPTNYLDKTGLAPIPINGFQITLTERGFRVNYSAKFLLKSVVNKTTDKIVYLFGKQGKKYRGMNSHRMALEVLGHAYLYVIGNGLITTSKVSKEISKLFPTGVLKRIMKCVSMIRLVAGSYLKNHAKTIDVTNNEAWYRLAVYEIIWRLVPYA